MKKIAYTAIAMLFAATLALTGCERESDKNRTGPGGPGGTSSPTDTDRYENPPTNPERTPGGTQPTDRNGIDQQRDMNLENQKNRESRPGDVERDKTDRTPSTPDRTPSTPDRKD